MEQLMMEQFIIEQTKNTWSKYVKINDESDLLAIYDLFKNNIIGKKYNYLICFYHGVYYSMLCKYDLMEICFLMIDTFNANQEESITTTNGHAMHHLAKYYKYINSDYKLMEKYCLLAIECNNSGAMYELGGYYMGIDNNLMKKYYLMAIDHNHVDAMYFLGNYYQHKETNYDLMKKYYLMAASNGDIFSMSNLSVHYDLIEKNHDSAMKYQIMAIKHGHRYMIDRCITKYKTISQTNVNDAIYFYNIANKMKHKYNAIIKALDNNYMVDKYHVIDYMQSMKISILISKYNNICINTKQVFLNYKQIMLFLWIIGGLVPKYIKLNIIVEYLLSV